MPSLGYERQHFYLKNTNLKSPLAVTSLLLTIETSSNHYNSGNTEERYKTLTNKVYNNHRIHLSTVEPRFSAEPLYNKRFSSVRLK